MFKPKKKPVGTVDAKQVVDLPANLLVHVRGGIRLDEGDSATEGGKLEIPNLK